jgi:hypothetical protein
VPATEGDGVDAADGEGDWDRIGSGDDVATAPSLVEQADIE